MLFESSENIRKEAFVGYVLGTIFNNGYVKHDWFTDENIEKGFKRAANLVFEAYNILYSYNKEKYVQKGTLNIYEGQELNSTTRVLMDLFEILMFGNYTSNANDEVPYELKMNLCFKIQSINMILVYNNRWQNKKLAKVYRNLNKEFNN